MTDQSQEPTPEQRRKLLKQFRRETAERIRQIERGLQRTLMGITHRVMPELLVHQDAGRAFSVTIKIVNRDGTEWKEEPQIDPVFAEQLHACANMLLSGQHAALWPDDAQALGIWLKRYVEREEGKMPKESEESLLVDAGGQPLDQQAASRIKLL